LLLESIALSSGVAFGATSGGRGRTRALLPAPEETPTPEETPPNLFAAASSKILYVFRFGGLSLRQYWRDEGRRALGMGGIKTDCGGGGGSWWSIEHGTGTAWTDEEAARSLPNCCWRRGYRNQAFFILEFSKYTYGSFKTEYNFKYSAVLVLIYLWFGCLTAKPNQCSCKHIARLLSYFFSFAM